MGLFTVLFFAFFCTCEIFLNKTEDGGMYYLYNLKQELQARDRISKNSLCTQVYFNFYKYKVIFTKWKFKLSLTNF